MLRIVQTSKQVKGCIKLFLGPHEVVSGNQVTKVRAVPVEVGADKLAGTKGRVRVVVGAYVPSYRDQHVDEVSLGVQVHSCPGKVCEDDESVVCRVLQQEGVEDRGQGEDRSVLLALSLTNRAHSSREIVPEEGGKALTND